MRALIAAAVIAGCGSRAAPEPPPVVTITAAWPGASPELVEQLVLVPLEQTVGAVPEVVHLYGMANAGAAVLVVELRGALEPATKEIRERIGTIQRQLPVEVSPPMIEIADPDVAPDRTIAIESATLDVVAKADLARSVIKPRLERLNGIGRVEVTGSETQLVVMLDPSRLDAMDVTVDEVGTAFEMQRGLPGGRVVQRPIITTLRDPESIGELVVGTHGVKLRDLASIRYTVHDSPLAIAVRFQHGADRDTGERLDEALAALPRELPPGVTVRATTPPPVVRTLLTITGDDRDRLEDQRILVQRALPAAKPQHEPVKSMAFDRARAAALGLDVAAVVRTLRYTTSPVASLSVKGVDLQIVFEVPVLPRLRVRSGKLGAVPLADVLRTDAMAVRERSDRRPAITLIVDGMTRDQVEERLEAVRAALPAGTRVVVR
ncbi:MAG: efflux RND transporter permease subunit [Kofleriaceae bacterium]